MKNDTSASLLIDQLNKFTKKDMQHVSGGLTYQMLCQTFICQGVRSV